MTRTKLFALALPVAVLLGGTALANDKAMLHHSHQTWSTGTGTGTSADVGDHIRPLRLEKNGTATAGGRIEDGKPIAAFDLPGSCLGELDKGAFAGNHVLYGFEVPAHTDVTVTASPDVGSAGVSLYAYELPATTRFEAPIRGAAQTRAVCKTSLAANSSAERDLRGIDRSVTFHGSKERRSVVVGVVAPTGTTGDYHLAVKTRAD